MHHSKDVLQGAIVDRVAALPDFLDKVLMVQSVKRATAESVLCKLLSITATFFCRSRLSKTYSYSQHCTAP